MPPPMTATRLVEGVEDMGSPFLTGYAVAAWFGAELSGIGTGRLRVGVDLFDDLQDVERLGRPDGHGPWPRRASASSR